MVTLRIDPRAAAAFDQRARELLARVTQRQRGTRISTWEPDIQIKATITEADIIGDIDYGLSNSEGKRISLEFTHQRETYVLGEEDYRLLDQLVAAALKDRELRTLVSARTLEDTARKWIRQRFRGETTEEFSSYATASLECQIESFRVWIPVDQLYVQQPFQLGNSEIQIISRDFIQSIGSSALDKQDRNSVDERFGKYQGHAAIVVNAVGDPKRAQEVALLTAEKTLAGLSLLSPAAFKCTIASAASLWGSKRLKLATTLLFSGAEMRQTNEGMIGPAPQSQFIDTARLRDFQPMIRSLHLVLTAETSSELAAKLVDALQVYARGVASPDPAEKLIYTFVALEMILLRNANEAVQDNVATRIAFLIGESVEERRRIISTTKNGYALRSAFVHHGARIEDTNAADEMLAVAWRALVELLNAPQRYRDVNELIRMLEDRKLQ
jgi:hypothetical protein